MKKKRKNYLAPDMELLEVDFTLCALDASAPYTGGEIVDFDDDFDNPEAPVDEVEFFW